MDSHEKEYLIVAGHLNKEPELGHWLWALQETRQRTGRELARLLAAMIDWRPEGNESSIGTVLYHSADSEADWLYVEVLERSLPSAVAALCPYATREEQGHLTQVQGCSLAEHLKRLATVRGLLLDVYQQMYFKDSSNHDQTKCEYPATNSSLRY